MQSRSTPFTGVRRRVGWCLAAAGTAVLAGCGASDDGIGSTARGTDVFAACRSADEEEPTFPIVSADESESIDMDGQNGWYAIDDRHTISTAGTVREAFVLSGGTSGLQALYIELDGRFAWTEFLWDDPMWSERTADDATWVTRDEAGAFEPSSRLAYSLQLNLATHIAADMEGRVFEGRVNSDGVDYLLYCADPAGFLHLRDDEPSARAFRFAVHPDGYVAEWMMALVTPDEVSCAENTVRIGPELDAVGLHDDPPAEWMTSLTMIPSCRDMYETEAATFAALHGDVPATEPTASPPPESTEPPATVVSTDWHEAANAECVDLAATAAGGADDELIARMATKFDEWSDDAAGELERTALTAAAAALRSDETRADHVAMDRIGRDLTDAGLGACGALFISG